MTMRKDQIWNCQKNWKLGVRHAFCRNNYMSQFGKRSPYIVMHFKAFWNYCWLIISAKSYPATCERCPTGTWYAETEGFSWSCWSDQLAASNDIDEVESTTHETGERNLTKEAKITRIIYWNGIPREPSSNELLTEGVLTVKVVSHLFWRLHPCKIICFLAI